MTDFRSEREQITVIEGLVGQTKHDEALFLAEKLVGDFPLSLQSNFLYFTILKKLEKFDRAEQVLKELYRVYPDNLKVLLELGEMAFRNRNFEESLAHYQRILFLDSFNTQARERMTVIQRARDLHLMERLEDTSVEWQAEKREVSPAAGIPSQPSSPTEAETADDMPVMRLGEIEFGSLDEATAFTAETREEKPAPPIVLAPDEEPVQIAPEPAPVVPVPQVESEPELVVDESLFPEFSAAVQEEWTQAEEAQAPDIEAEMARMPADFRAMLEEEAPPPSVQEIPPMEEPVAEEEEQPALDEVEIGFETESAADLYYKQGFYREALAIYEKLYQRSGEARFRVKIDLLSRAARPAPRQRVVERLERFLQLIQEKGERLV